MTLNGYFKTNSAFVPAVYSEHSTFKANHKKRKKIDAHNPKMKANECSF